MPYVGVTKEGHGVLVLLRPLGTLTEQVLILDRFEQSRALLFDSLFQYQYY